MMLSVAPANAAPTSHSQTTAFGIAWDASAPDGSVRETTVQVDAPVVDSDASVYVSSFVGHDQDTGAQIAAYRGSTTQQLVTRLQEAVTRAIPDIERQDKVVLPPNTPA